MEDFSLSFPDWQANSFSVDYSGRKAVLAVQKFLAVVSLEPGGDGREARPLRKLAKQSKYEIKAALWSPHSSQCHLIASTCQQKLEVWDVAAERHPLVCSIKAHTRPVSDLSWSFTEPHLLASCAIDSFVHVWDIRETRKPKMSFKAVAGASLVQWNRVNGSVLASAHDSDIRIWDMRKPTTASGYISAHMTRVHDIDWSYVDSHSLTTCSHDASVKFWDTTSTREPVSSIKTGQQPVWRARNYPPGHAVAMALVPAMHGGDNRVFLWDKSNVSSPVHVFTGHSEPVLEVQWRRCGGVYQLVSWARDRCLRVWCLSEQLQGELVGAGLEQTLAADDSTTSLASLESSGQADKEEGAIPDGTKSFDPSLLGIGPRTASTGSASSPSLTRSLPPSTLSDPALRSPQPPVFQPQHTLDQEFSLLNLDYIANLELERLEASQRSCTVKLQESGHVVRFAITFPAHYPNGAAPSFVLDNESTIDITTQQELLKIVNETALSYVRTNRPCLEPCLRKMSKALESFVSRPQPPSKPPDFSMPFGHLDDVHIPFPRTSGARFCSNGVLVCFSLPPGLVLPANVTTTPRSIDKMNVFRSYIRPTARGPQRRTAYLSTSLPKRGSGGALSSLAGREVAGKMFQLEKGGGDSFGNPYAGTVTVHNVVRLLPVDYHLATAYRLMGSDVEAVQDVCELNASAAEAQGRTDLVQAWATAALIADVGMSIPESPWIGIPWSQHPFGRELIHSLFGHFARLHDVQTLAMLACVFQLHEKLRPLPPIRQNGNTHKPSPTKRLSGAGQGAGLGEKTGVFQDGGGDSVYQEEETLHRLNCRLLDSVLIRQCDEFRRCYGNILYSWGMLSQRSEVLKFQSHGRDKRQMEIGVYNVCSHCGDHVRGPSCPQSKCFALRCSICNIAVRGSANVCLLCGHGGHTQHIRAWFEQQSDCPAGCGCSCLETSGWT